MYATFIGVPLTSLEGFTNWDTSSVKNISYMFQDNNKITNLKGLSNWDVSKVTNFNNMFFAANLLEDTSEINNWSISADASYYRMFSGQVPHPEFTKVPGTWNSGTFNPSN